MTRYVVSLVSSLHVFNDIHRVVSIKYVTDVCEDFLLVLKRVGHTVCQGKNTLNIITSKRKDIAYLYIKVIVPGPA